MNTRFLQFAVLMYFVVFGLTMVEYFLASRVWPNEAVSYYLWWKSQPRTGLLAVLPYVGLGFTGLSLIAALGLLLRVRAVVVPYGFSFAAVGLVFCELLGAVFDPLPQMNTPYEMFLDSALAILTGVIIVLSLIKTTNTRL